MHLCLVAKEHIERCPPLLRLINLLAKEGHGVTVFCAGGNGGIPSLVEGFRADRVQLFRSPTVGGTFRIVRPFLETGRLASLIREHRTPWDAVIAYDPFGLAAAASAGISSPLIYYSAELYESARFILQVLSERRARKRVCGLITCQEDRGNLLAARLQFHGPRLVMPNTCFDYLTEAQKGLGQGWSKPAAPVAFIYQGGLQPYERCLYELVDIFAQTELPVRLRLVLMGPPRSVNAFRAYVAKTPQPERIEFADPLPYPRHFTWTCRSHIGLMLYRNVSRNYRFCAPNKLFEYPMLGLPVLASNQPHLADVIEGHKIGVCVDPEDKNSIAAGIKTMATQLDLQAAGRRAREWYLAHGRYELHYDRFKEFLQAVLQL
jgi:glycosyltransferase involved in cell wall biosynthesis